MPARPPRRQQADGELEGDRQRQRDRKGGIFHRRRRLVVVEPTTRLSDSKQKDYALTLDKPAGAEHTIAVRVSDECDNQAVAKVVIK